ncbi:MAG: polyphosphate polymerase domain-containing protein [Eubacteriales bacterium]
MQYRKEQKFIISKREFDRIKVQLDLLMKPDENAKDGEYLVRSLYFDTVNDHDLLTSLSGVMHKSKLRLRVYPPKMDEIKLELKEKVGYDGLKTSVSISREQAEELMKSQYSFLLKYESEAAKKIYLHLASRPFFPKVVVEYKRIVLKHPVSNTRVTYDYDAMATRAYKTFFDEDVLGSRVHDKAIGVLEVKYDNFLLSTIKQTLEGVDELRTANSKYANARLIF